MQKFLRFIQRNESKIIKIFSIHEEQMFFLTFPFIFVVVTKQKDAFKGKQLKCENCICVLCEIRTPAITL